MELSLSICLGVGLAACCGFRVFVPLLVTNLAVMFGLATVSPGFEWLGSWPAFAILVTATLAEIMGYYVPFVDNVLDVAAAPLAFLAGTVLTVSFLRVDSPILKWALGLMMGGGTAGFVQANTAMVRLLSTKFSGGVANPIFASFENIVSIAFSIVTFWLPVLAFAMALLLIVWIIWKLVPLTRKRTSSTG